MMLPSSAHVGVRCCVWSRSMAIRHKKYDVVRTLVTRFNADVGLESCGYTPLILAAINDGT